MKSAFTVAFAAVAAALPAKNVARSADLKFTGLALRSASPIHYGSINANSEAFYIGKNTTTYCPTEGDAAQACATVNNSTTIFAYDCGLTTLGLYTEVPGGQSVYVTEGDDKTGQLAGQLKFTQAHSVATSGPALVKGFSVTTDNALQFEGKDWFACPIDEFNSGYGIWAISRVAGSNAGAGCLDFSWLVSEVNSTAAAAWEYVK